MSLPSFTGQVVNQITRDLRVTLSEYVSSFGQYSTPAMNPFLCYDYEQFLISGGTVGLFTGMSIISLFEFIFWILNSLLKFPKFMKRKR